MATITLTKRELKSGVLPRICMKCGEPTRKPISRTMTFWPVYLRIIVVFCVFLALLPGLIVHGLVERTLIHIPSRLPLCDRHKNHWSIPNYIGLAAFVLALSGIFLNLAIRDKYAAPSSTVPLLCLALFIGGVIAAVVVSSFSLKVTGVDGKDVDITNVCDEFADALEEEEDVEEGEVVDGEDEFEEEPVRAKPTVRKPMPTKPPAGNGPRPKPRPQG